MKTEWSFFFRILIFQVFDVFVVVVVVVVMVAVYVDVYVEVVVYVVVVVVAVMELSPSSSASLLSPLYNGNRWPPHYHTHRRANARINWKHCTKPTHTSHSHTRDCSSYGSRLESSSQPESLCLTKQSFFTSSTACRTRPRYCFLHA